MHWLGIAGAAFLILLFIRPTRRIALCLLRTALALCGIAALNPVAARFGIAVGTNLINAALVGFFGLPGIAAVLALDIII